MENDRLLADESFSSQDYVSATNIEERKKSAVLGGKRSAARRRITFSPDLCECNEHRGTERFRDEREERKKSAVLGGK